MTRFVIWRRNLSHPSLWKQMGLADDFAVLEDLLDRFENCFTNSELVLLPEGEHPTRGVTAK